MQGNESMYPFGDNEGQLDPRLASGGVVSPSSTSTSRSMASFSTPYRPGVSPETLHSSNVTPDNQQNSNLANASAQDQKRTRACESCRSLKVRCEPDTANPDGSCRRCAKAHRECIFTVPTRKRQKRTDSRVAELERKIDKLTATLNARRRGESGPINDLTDSDASDVETRYTPGKHSQSRTASSHNDCGFGDSDQYRESEPKRQRLMSKDTGASRRSSSVHDMEDVSNDGPPMFGTRTDHSSSSSAPSKSHFAVPRHSKYNSMPTPETDPSSITSPAQGSTSNDFDIIDRKIISMEAATTMFNHYVENLAVHYPAVTFPRGTTAADVRKHKPFLFLAILAASSAVFDPDLNRYLNKEVIKSIAERVIVNGEKSLEIIQVLAIATLWYYPPDQFEELKFYQLTHIAAVMAIDVGINRPGRAGARRVPFGPGGLDCPSISRVQQVLLRPLYDVPTSGVNTEKGFPRELTGWKKTWLPDPSTLESRRAFLCCYWMCSNVAMSLRRPNLLRYAPYMGDCIEFIESSPEATVNDKVICQWIKLQRITEEVGIAFGYEDSVAKVNLAETRIQFALKGFERQLEEWEKNLPKECETKTLRLASFTLSLFMHEVALHGDHSTEDFRPPFLEDKLLRRPDPKQGPVTQLTQSHINALFSCLSSAHGLLDGFLSFSVDELRCLPVLFFARVAYAIVLLIKIYFSVTAAKSEVGKVIEKPQLKLDYYFEKLLALLKAAAADDKSKPATKFFLILTMLSHWYHYQQRASSKGASGRRLSVIPQSPGFRGEQPRPKDENPMPPSPRPGYRQMNENPSNIAMHTPHSTSSRETPQPSADPMIENNAPTPLHMLSDVATTAEDSSTNQNTNMMNIDGGNFGSTTSADIASTLFNAQMDDVWLSNPVDMSMFGIGDMGMGFGVNLETFNLNTFPGFGDGSSDLFGDGNGGNNSGFFDGWPGS
ncbi:hypothetical protein ABW19_dt0200584 [Dactylella cylindrospora]|nr:hypothetical protein ABW19_dt0200584 [Dactylella cylindrospora]